MRLSKRFGLGTIFASLALATFLILGQKALAAGPNLNLEFGDTSGKTIVGKYNNQKFTFQINNQDTNGVSTIYEISSSDAGPICPGSLIQVPTNIANHPAATTAVQPGGKIGDLKYKPAGSSTCTVYPDLQMPVSAPGAPTTGAGSTSAAKTQINWSEAHGKLNSDGSQLVVTFTDNTTITLKDKSPGDSTINFKPISDSVGLIDGVTINSWCGDNTAYGAGDKSYGITLASYTATTGTVKVCYDNGGPQTVTQPSGSGTITIPVNTSAYVDPNAGSTGTGSNTCEDNPWTLSWLACPILEGVDSLVNDLDGFIQDQLNFNTSDNLNSNVHQLWMAIRDISSIFLIIIMLVMVIAQALGGLGGLDAYTVRKILPKIIIAVIFAQVSWPLLIAVINIANDAGKGIADIMFFPFNGPSQMSLLSLVKNLGYGAPSSITGIALFAGILVTILNPFGVLIFALAVVMAVLTAVATLMFRTALIIGCVAFFPLFMMAWILPGTKKYWDMWRTNFSKALMMFPLIMAMIAIGRIFAWISGNTGGHTGPFDAIAVLVGYFGPYFFIPKAFKWGGSLLAQANGAISGVSKKVQEKPNKYLQTGKERLDHFRQEKSAQRVYKDPKHRGNILLGDPFRSGKWDVRNRIGTGREFSRERVGAQVASYVAQGKKAAGEEVQNYATLISAEIENMNRSDAVKHLVDKVEHSEGSERWAAMQKLAQLQAGKQLTQIRDDLAHEGEAGFWNNFVNGNYDQLKGISPHLANGYEAGSTTIDDAGRFNGMKDEELAPMSDYGWTRYAEVDAAAAEAALRRIVDNENLRPRLHPQAVNNLNEVLRLTGRPQVTITPGASSVATDPTEIRLQHQTNYTISLPPAASVAAAGAVREAYKARILSDAGTSQTLAHAFAYDVDPASRPVHDAIVQEIRAGIGPGSPPDRIAAFNGFIDRIQQSYTQRINEAATHARATAPAGTDPNAAAAAAAQAAQASLAGQMAHFESMRIT